MYIYEAVHYLLLLVKAYFKENKNYLLTYFTVDQLVMLFIYLSPSEWGRLTLNWVQILEQSKDERTLNSVFWVSAKATLLAVTALHVLILTTPNNECFLYIAAWKTYPFLINCPKRWEYCILPSSKKVLFRSLFLFKHQYQVGYKVPSPDSLFR